MELLEYIYEANYPKIHFFERKVSITCPYTVLVGSPKSGKTYLIYDYLSSFDKKETLYIDFDDYKNSVENLEDKLSDFVKLHNIKVLALDNFKFDITLPEVDSIIISTYHQKTLSNFTTVEVSNLDFEEFLLFDTKHQNLLYSYNSFLKYGNLPEILEYSDIKKTDRNIEVCKLFCHNEIELKVLMLFIKIAGEKKSIYQLFNTIKKDTKISKDRFYALCQYFIDNKLIYFVEKYNQPKSAKKIYIFNHALIDTVSYKKNFNNLFKNMVYLELRKRYDSLYYIDNIDFYLKSEDSIVLAIPFYNDMLSAKIISKLIPQIDTYSIKNITIVTVSLEQIVYISEIETSIIPFNQWALIL